jgi:ribulose-bisphosphate carboxylase large chain
VSVERIEADYFIETAYDVRKAVEAMAGEQSSGTFLPVPGETPELKARSAARVENLEVLGEADPPSLPGSGAPREGGRRLTARATLSWPLDNIGPSLPNLMATVAGNLFELKQFSGLRILDMRLTRVPNSASTAPVS